MPLTLDILEMGVRGDGIAEQDGERYFVPFTLPGEVVEAEPADKRGEGIAAELVEVLAPSRHRETPSGWRSRRRCTCRRRTAWLGT